MKGVQELFVQLVQKRPKWVTESCKCFIFNQVTSRLSAVDALPVERLLGYGARFLQEDYSAWAQQQGGYVRNLSFFPSLIGFLQNKTL